MPLLVHTTVTTAVMALVLFVLSGRVLLMRIQRRQPLGDGGDAVLARAIRVQANFAEHVPMALLLLLLLEWHGAPAALLKVYGALLVTARIVHALGVSQPNEQLRWRAVSTAVTLAQLSLGAAFLLAWVWLR